jgi:serine/threonine-protein phosphatase 6 regulatory ankyrin repeat subunit B
VNTPGNDRAATVSSASIKGHDVTVGALAALGADVNAPTKNGWTPLMFAAWNGDAKVAAALLKAGVSPKTEQSPVTRANALSMAKDKRHAKIVALLEKA